MSRSGLIQLVIVALVLLVLALLAPELSGTYARPVPAVYDTLARFLPAGAELVDLEPTATPGIFRFEAARFEAARFEATRFEATGADHHVYGEVTAQATLLWLANPIEAQTLPEGLRAALIRESPPAAAAGARADEGRIERLQLMAYRVVTTRAGGLRDERFLDPSGQPLWQTGGPPEPEMAAPAERLAKLPEPVARTLRRHLGSASAEALRRESDLGASLHAARWRSGYGEQQVKVLDNGLALWLELPHDEPLPPAVAALAPPAAEIRALLLEIYRSRAADGRVLAAVLANGTPIHLPEPALR